VFLCAGGLAKFNLSLNSRGPPFGRIVKPFYWIPMKNACFLVSLAGAVLLCGCGKQTKINTEEIKLLSQQMVLLQQTQARQMAEIQSQLVSLAPMLDKINNFYFEKARDDALSYHTNTLYLLLAVDKNIESELQVADAERQSDSSLIYSYHTNEMDLLNFYAVQIQDAMITQESRIEDRVNDQTRQAVADVRDELMKQIKLSAPDEAATARLKQMEADVAQIKLDLDQIKSQLAAMTNPPPARP
jgi:hypothetical protein